MKKRLRSAPLAAALALIAGLLGVATTAGIAAADDCQLNSPGGNIQHVISILFDNTHFLRDETSRRTWSRCRTS
jgi:hypothetical protein